MTGYSGGGALTLARRCVAAIEALQQAGDSPDAAQRAAMAGWAGWGPLAPAFNWDQKEPAWLEIRKRLEGALTPAQLKDGKDAVDTAFYTPRAVTGAVWDIVTGLGFTGGDVFEPGCGAGYFMAATPACLPVQWTGVETDQVSAKIARHLHPEARIIHGRLEKTTLRVGSFDLVVGNVPFSAAGPYDAAAPCEMNLHNYFLWRSLMACRPGGLVACVTSRWTLDAKMQAQREALAELGGLIGAVRLPGAALAPGGTQAVTDIVVFQRHPSPGVRNGDQRWLKEPTTPDGLSTTVSDYYQANPHMVLGTMRDRHGQQYGATLEVVPHPGVTVADLLTVAAGRIAQAGASQGMGWQPPADRTALADVPAGFDPATDGRLTLHPDGSVTRQDEGRQVPVRATKKAAPELAALIRLRDAAVALFAAETDLAIGDNRRNRIRQEALRQYKEFTARYGPLNRADLRSKPDPDGDPGDVIFERITGNRPIRELRGDPDYPTLIAIEIWDDDTQTANPAPILLRHVNRPAVRKTRTDDPAEALALSLDETGQLDLMVIAGLLDVPEAEVPGLLGDLLYEDLEDGWVTADEFLSGNVRVKLAQAQRAAAADPDRWQRNVDALEQVQLADLGPDEINVQLGSPWIPADDIARFVYAILEIEPSSRWKTVDVIYSPINSAWEVHGNTELRRTPAATTTWGTGRVNCCDLVEHALNGRMPVVTDPVPGEKDVRVRNPEETQLAAEKIRELQERFTEWLWEDPARTERLCREYNIRFNSTRIRKYDGSHLTFPGLAADFRPYPSQKDMVWRSVCTPADLCAHTVGGGKTAIMVMTAMTLRRLGLTSKPLMIVPNHLLDQETAEARRLFPGAQILMVTREDLSPARRKTFAAKCCARDWDLILMTHQQFMAIPVSPATEREFIAAEIEDLEAAVMDGKLAGTRTAKQLAKKRKKLVARHEALLDARRDDGLTFEQTGITYVMADEGHLFKNRELSCRAEGFSTAGSKRAEDLAMKFDWLRGRNTGGRCGGLFTGTPISNALSELFVILKYLMPDRLKELGLACFDAFAGMYIRYETATEVAPDGSGFRQYRRPARYCNLPELRVLLGQVADIRTKTDLALPGPRVDLEHVTVPGQPELAQFTASLVERADKIRSGGVRPDEDNMLSICTDGRRGALDLRLAGIEPTGPGKIEAVAERIAGIYHAMKDTLYPDTSGDGGSLFDGTPGALQLVFCDQGTPRTSSGGGYDGQVYGRLCDTLEELGVPRSRIAFVHDATSHAARAELFARCRTGQISVLIASTEKAGTGVNIQPRLVAVHHADAPWRPADVEQRDGRGDRPGNLNPALRIIRYVTEKSFDAYMWQALQRKAAFIAQILCGGTDAREIEDGGNPQVLSFAELKSLATGQPLLLELSRVQAEISRLKAARAGHKRNQNRLAGDWSFALERVRQLEGQANMLDRIAEEAAGAPRTLSGYGAGDAAIAELGRVLDVARSARQAREVGRYRGVYVTVKPNFRGSKAAPGITVSIDASYSARYAHEWSVWSHVWKPGGAAALLAEIDQVMDRAGQLAAERREEALRAQARADEIEPYLGQAWPHEATLAAALAAREDLEREIDAQVTQPAAAEAERAPEPVLSAA